MAAGLVDQLRGWSPEQVAGLLQLRPDLVHPSPPHHVGQLAQRAQSQLSVDAAIAAATLSQHRLLQLVVCCPPDVPLDDLAAALPEGLGIEDIEATVSVLEAAALVWRHGGRLRSSATLRHTMPTTLGPPLRQLINDHKVDYLKAVLTLLRKTLADHGFDGALPPRASGPDGRPPRKAELVDELESLLVVPGLVRAVLAGAPPECAAIAAMMADGRPVVTVDHPMYFSAYRTYYHEYPTYWLFERGLLLPFRYDRTAVQPREVGVALRGGRPVADLALVPPVLAVATVKPAQVDAHGSAQAELTLDRLADLLQAWGQAPAKTLKSGGLGATVMKQAAAILETDVESAACLVELAQLGGLLEATTVTNKQRRTYVHNTTVGPSVAASAWLARPVATRWRQLATAWLRANYWPSSSGRKDADAKIVPVLSPQYAPSAPEMRRGVLDVLASMDPGGAATSDTVTDTVYWRRPQPWLGLGSVGDGRSAVVGWIYAEAELLGIVAGGALSSFGRAVLADDRRTAEEAFEAARPEPVTTFTLQADLTATVVGTLERSVRFELRLLADVESTGAATTLRFSDASLRRALDAGRDGEAILSFLDAHATKGVPKPLAYLVSDVARRHGNLQVGEAGSFVTSEDPAVLADACSHRRTRKLALRLLAPTVAVSPHPHAKVLAGLRDAGFLPAVDGDEVADAEGASAVSLGSPTASTTNAAVDRMRASSDHLPEPFRARTWNPQRPVPSLDAPAAANLAEAILAGGPGDLDALEVDDPGPRGGAFPTTAAAGTLALAFPHDPALLGMERGDDWDFEDEGPFSFDDERSSPDLLAYDDDLADEDLAVDELAVLRALMADRPRSGSRRSSRGRWR